MHAHMVAGYYSNLYLLFTLKIVLLLMLFTCLLVMMVRMREMIKILREIRDKK